VSSASEANSMATTGALVPEARRWPWINHHHPAKAAGPMSIVSVFIEGQPRLCPPAYSPR